MIYILFDKLSESETPSFLREGIGLDIAKDVWLKPI